MWQRSQAVRHVKTTSLLMVEGTGETEAEWLVFLQK